MPEENNGPGNVLDPTRLNIKRFVIAVEDCGEIGFLMDDGEEIFCLPLIREDAEELIRQLKEAIIKSDQNIKNLN